MKQKIFTLLFIVFACTQIFAQDFYGFVKKADSTSSAIYQADVVITENYKPFKTLKTYFDGAFKFTPEKDQIYTIKISYSGYKDTTYTITTEKNGKLSAQNVTVKLKKDGMRLMGVIKSADENFPIKEATIVLKNVMTRKEDRLTTDIDGRYNFKMEYETNYRVSIDKRSAGVFNKYKDTTFYISTIGFNQPLDYKLDIVLDAMLYPTTTAREGYDASKQVSANVKPVIEVAANSSVEKQPFVVEDKKLKNVQDANAKLQAELEEAKKQIDDLKKKEIEQKKFSGGGIAVSKKTKTDPNIEVVVIRDEPVTTKKQSDSTLANITKQKQEAEKREKLLEAEIAKQKIEEANRKVQDLAAQQKAKEDSLAAAKEESDMRMMALAMQKQKAKDDSIAQVKAKLEKIAQEVTAKKLHEDSLAKAAQERVAKELALKKAKDDSVAQAKVEQARVAKELALEKAYHDSVSKAVVAIHARFVQDSITRAKAEQDRAAKELASRKMYEDSITKVISAAKAHEKFIVDSLAKANAAQQKAAKELALKKATEDSVARVQLAQRTKFVADSISKVAQLRVAKEQADKKALNDSLARVHLAVRKKFTQDSIALVIAQKEKTAKELTARKTYEDSVSKVVAAMCAKSVQDSILKTKAEVAAKEKAKQDSVAQAKAQQARIAKELASRKTYEDSISKIIAAANAHEKFVVDSLGKVKAAELKAAKELALKKAKEDSVARVQLAVRAKFVADSISAATQVRVAKEQADKKTLNDSIAKVQIAARKKFIEDSMALVTAQKAKAAKELATRKAYEDSLNKAVTAAHTKFIQDSVTNAKAAVVARQKARQDSLERVKAEIVRDAALKRSYEDSISKASLFAEAKSLQESLRQLRDEKEKIAREMAERKKLETSKAMQDSIVRAKADKEHKALVESLSRTKEELQKAEQELIAQKKNEEAQSSARQKAMDDLKIEKERISWEVNELKNKEAAERKVREENLRNQQMQDAMAKAAAEQHTKEQARVALEKQKQDSIANAQIVLAAKQKEETERKLREENLRKQQQQEIITKQKAEAEAKAKAENLRKQQEQETAAKLAAEQKAQVAAQEQKEIEKQKSEEQIKAAEKKPVDTTTYSTQLPSTEAQADYGKLPAVIFDKNDFILSATAKAELKLVAQKLLKHPELMLNIYAFASQDETHARQIALRRSDAVLRFFIDNGVAIEQVKSFYYGTTVSRNGCVSLNCPETQQQQNRSVAYQIVTQ